MTHITADEVADAQAWAAQIDACTCPTEWAADSGRYVVNQHTCPHCQAWDQTLTDLGITIAPQVVIPDRTVWQSRRNRTRTRRAA